MKKNISVSDFLQHTNKQSASFYPLFYDGQDKFAIATKCHICGNPLYQRSKMCFPFFNKRDTVLPTFQWHCGYSTKHLDN